MKLTNTFSWSFSAAADFEICPRKRYWSKYAAWGGWEAQAPAEARTVYRLNKMESRHTLMGRATEQAVMWALREYQAGRTPGVEEIYAAQARPLLNQAWKESKSGLWRQDPKHHVCLHEDYYPHLHPDLPPDWPAQLRAHVLTCITHFLQSVWPRLDTVTSREEIQLGAPESFAWEGITVYAVPDYVYRRGDHWHIHDWKAGRASARHRHQLAVYALWAHEKHGVPPENIQCYIEYLHQGHVAMEPGSEELLEEARAAIRQSVADMAAYLNDGDVQRNHPRPREEWDMTPDRRICDRCNFYELCRPEFE